MSAVAPRPVLRGRNPATGEVLEGEFPEATTGEIEKAIPMLEQSEKDFPDDYNPPARLSSAYLKLKKYDQALACNDRALAKVYGPRRLRVLATRADIYAGMGNEAEARNTRQQALAYAESLPEGQRSDSAIASLKKQLGEGGGGSR